MVLEQGKPLSVQYELKFVSTDQEVSDLSAPKPENNWCFMEFPKDELAALEAGAIFRLQAHSVGLEGNAALCTTTKTYGLEFLENSNSLLVAGLRTKEVGAEGESEPRLEVFGQVRGQLILKPEIGDTTRLKELLRPHAPGANLEGGPEKPTIGALEYEVAASTSELHAALSDGPYVEDNGLWSMLQPRLERDIVDTVVNLVAANGWSLEALSVNEVFPQVQTNLGEATVPSVAVLRKALRSVMAVVADAKSTSDATSPEATQASQPKAPSGDGDVLHLDQKKVQRFQALALLGDTPGRVRERFQLAAPGPRKRARVHGAGGLAAAGGMGREQPLTVAELTAAVRELSSNEELSEEQVLQLLGTDAYIDELENTVHRLNAAESLPQGPRDRLKELFQLTSHWRPERLGELIQPTLGSQKVDPWLMKYARAVFVQDDSGTERRLMTKKFTGL